MMGMSAGADYSGGGAIRGALRNAQQQKYGQPAPGTGGVVAPGGRGTMPWGVNNPRVQAAGGGRPPVSGGVVGPPVTQGRVQNPMGGGRGGRGDRMAQQQALAQRMRGGARPRGYSPPNPTGNRAPMRGGRPMRMGGYR